MKLFRKKSALETFYSKNEKVIDYTVASIVCTIILYFIYFTVTWASGGHYVIANLLAYIVSFSLLYIWDQEIFWAKPKRKKDRIKQLNRFIIFRFIGFGIDSGLLILFIEIFLIPNAFAKIMASMMVFVYNYYVNKLFVFTDRNSVL